MPKFCSNLEWILPGNYFGERNRKFSGRSRYIVRGDFFLFSLLTKKLKTVYPVSRSKPFSLENDVTQTSLISLQSMASLDSPISRSSRRIRMKPRIFTTFGTINRSVVVAFCWYGKYKHFYKILLCVTSPPYSRDLTRARGFQRLTCLSPCAHSFESKQTKCFFPVSSVFFPVTSKCFQGTASLATGKVKLRSV